MQEDARRNVEPEGEEEPKKRVEQMQWYVDSGNGHNNARNEI